MTKRQRRIKQKDIPPIADTLIGTTVNLVLKDNTVHLLKIEKLEDSIFVAKDYNNRLHKIPFTKIEEIIQDYHA